MNRILLRGDANILAQNRLEAFPQILIPVSCRVERHVDRIRLAVTFLCQWSKDQTEVGEADVQFRFQLLTEQSSKQAMGRRYDRFVDKAKRAALLSLKDATEEGPVFGIFGDDRTEVSPGCGVLTEEDIESQDGFHVSGGVD